VKLIGYPERNKKDGM